MLSPGNFLNFNTNFKQNDNVDCIAEPKKYSPQLVTKMSLVTLKQHYTQYH